jgi:hypothetical protein
MTKVKNATKIEDKDKDKTIPKDPRLATEVGAVIEQTKVGVIEGRDSKTIITVAEAGVDRTPEDVEAEAAGVDIVMTTNGKKWTKIARTRQPIH